MNGVKEILGGIGNYYVTLLRNHDIWKAVLAGKRYTRVNYKGFSFRCDVKPYRKGTYMTETEKIELIPSNSEFYMKKIIRLCRKKGAELLLVSTPSPSNYNYARHNGIHKFAKDNSLEFLDMNLNLNEIGIDWEEDSLDSGDHLNLKGARKVTAYLGQYLKKQYHLPDHRNEMAYHLWDVQYRYYKKRQISF